MGLINFTTKESQEDKYVFTKYSVFHFFYGFLWYIVHFLLYKNKFIKESFILMNLFHIIFEFLENTEFSIKMFRKNEVWKNYMGDSRGNSCGDVISGIIGFISAYYIIKIFSNSK